jgi:hypothetical protein
MFEALLKAGGESWDAYYVVDDKWPAEGVLETYKVRGHRQLIKGPIMHAHATAWLRMQGIVVTGSASDSFSDEPWIVRLRAELARVAARRQRVLGVCFGCQVMALVLGGKAGAPWPCTRQLLCCCEQRMRSIW